LASLQKGWTVEGGGSRFQAVTAEEDEPLSVEERRHQRLENWFNSDRTEELEAQQAQAEEERKRLCALAGLGSGVVSLSLPNHAL
tara:strand:- start:414 stop:668 length:255 start_codon:yes stop_codon:yes gene_type:complete